MALIGFEYGATVAFQLSLNENGAMPTILINPISDIGAMSSSIDLREWPYHVMGVNYSIASVPNEILSKACRQSSACWYVLQSSSSSILTWFATLATEGRRLQRLETIFFERIHN